MKKLIIKYLFKKRLVNIIRKSKRTASYVSYSKAQNVLILFESDQSEDNTIIRNIISSLQEDGKKVTAWGFIDKKAINSPTLQVFRILHHQQTDYFHQPIQSYINELSSMKFDLLIDLTLRPIIPLQYLAAYANATCKAGIHATEPGLYDFLLDIKNINSTVSSKTNLVTELYLFNQIIFYLKNIQTKN